VASRGRPQVTVRAQIDADEVERAFYNEWAQGDRFWYWIRSIRLDPDELIIEDEATGDLYRLPFLVNEREVTFEEPQAVYVSYVDDTTKKEVANAKAVIGSWHKASAARSRFRATEEVKMDPKKLREQLGLPEDATDEDVEAKIAELVAASAETPPKPDDDDDDEEQEDDNRPPNEETGTPVPGTQEPATALAASGVVSVDAAALARLQQDAQMGRQAREQQIAAERGRMLDDAIKAGKFAPSRRDHFLKLLAADESGTKKLIDDLAENVIPVEARGDSSIQSPNEVAAVEAAYPNEWLTEEERTRRDAFYARQRQEVS
jgi:hypothetical protein